MTSNKTLEVDIAAPSLVPRKLAEDAAAVLEGDERAAVAYKSGRAVLRAVWEVDADLAIFKIQEALKIQLRTSAPRLVYLKEPDLLEPVMQMHVTIPEIYLGDVMGDINRRRGLITGMEDLAERGKRIECKVPLAELFGYISDLKSMSNGSGSAEVNFDSYQPAPRDPNPDPDEPWSGALRA